MKVRIKIMTVEELRVHFNNTFPPDKQWPDRYEVDAETYANVCQFIFWKKADMLSTHFIEVAIGKYGGIMFKGVELLIKK